MTSFGKESNAVGFGLQAGYMVEGLQVEAMVVLRHFRQCSNISCLLVEVRHLLLLSEKLIAKRLAHVLKVATSTNPSMQAASGSVDCLKAMFGVVLC